MPITTCVFDAYGTLFDVAAAARIAADEPGREAFAAKWPQIAQDWRLKQLQYTWLRAVADAHTDFWEVTQNGLDYALEAAGLQDQATYYWRVIAVDAFGSQGVSSSAPLPERWSGERTKHHNHRFLTEQASQTNCIPIDIL